MKELSVSGKSWARLITQGYIKVKLLVFKEKFLEPIGKMTKLFLKIRKHYGHQMSQEHIHYGKVIVEKDFHEIQENLVGKRFYV